MTFVHLANLMQNWGWKIKPKHYESFSIYVREMLARGQVMIVMDNELIEAVLFFCITSDYSKVYKKSTWAIPESEEGHQLYIDKMVCRKWTKNVRESVQYAIQEKFPHIEEAYYHRAPYDRCVKIMKREKYDASTVS